MVLFGIFGSRNARTTTNHYENNDNVGRGPEKQTVNYQLLNQQPYSSQHHPSKRPVISSHATSPSPPHLPPQNRPFSPSSKQHFFGAYSVKTQEIDFGACYRNSADFDADHSANNEEDDDDDDEGEYETSTADEEFETPRSNGFNGVRGHEFNSVRENRVGEQDPPTVDSSTHVPSKVLPNPTAKPSPSSNRCHRTDDSLRSFPTKTLIPVKTQNSTILLAPGTKQKQQHQQQQQQQQQPQKSSFTSQNPTGTTKHLHRHSTPISTETMSSIPSFPNEKTSISSSLSLLSNHQHRHQKSQFSHHNNNSIINRQNKTNNKNGQNNEVVTKKMTIIHPYHHHHHHQNKHQKKLENINNNDDSHVVINNDSHVVINDSHVVINPAVVSEQQQQQQQQEKHDGDDDIQKLTQSATTIITHQHQQQQSLKEEKETGIKNEEYYYNNNNGGVDAGGLMNTGDNVDENKKSVFDGNRRHLVLTSLTSSPKSPFTTITTQQQSQQKVHYYSYTTSAPLGGAGKKEVETGLVDQKIGDEEKLNENCCSPNTTTNDDNAIAQNFCGSSSINSSGCNNNNDTILTTTDASDNNNNRLVIISGHNTDLTDDDGGRDGSTTSTFTSSSTPKTPGQNLLIGHQSSSRPSTKTKINTQNHITNNSSCNIQPTIGAAEVDYKFRNQCITIVAAAVEQDDFIGHSRQPNLKSTAKFWTPQLPRRRPPRRQQQQQTTFLSSSSSFAAAGWSCSQRIIKRNWSAAADRNRRRSGSGNDGLLLEPNGSNVGNQIPNQQADNRQDQKLIITKDRRIKLPNSIPALTQSRFCPNSRRKSSERDLSPLTADQRHQQRLCQQQQQQQPSPVVLLRPRNQSPVVLRSSYHHYNHQSVEDCTKLSKNPVAESSFPSNINRPVSLLSSNNEDPSLILKKSSAASANANCMNFDHIHHSSPATEPANNNNNPLNNNKNPNFDKDVEDGRQAVSSKNDNEEKRPGGRNNGSSSRKKRPISQSDYYDDCGLLADASPPPPPPSLTDIIDSREVVGFRRAATANNYSYCPQFLRSPSAGHKSIVLAGERNCSILETKDDYYYFGRNEEFLKHQNNSGVSISNPNLSSSTNKEKISEEENEDWSPAKSAQNQYDSGIASDTNSNNSGGECNPGHPDNSFSSYSEAVKFRRFDRPFQSQTSIFGSSHTPTVTRIGRKLISTFETDPETEELITSTKRKPPSPSSRSRNRAEKTVVDTPGKIFAITATMSCPNTPILNKSAKNHINNNGIKARRPSHPPPPPPQTPSTATNDGENDGTSVPDPRSLMIHELDSVMTETGFSSTQPAASAKLAIRRKSEEFSGSRLTIASTEIPRFMFGEDPVQSSDMSYPLPYPSLSAHPPAGATNNNNNGQYPQRSSALNNNNNNNNNNSNNNDNSNSGSISNSQQKNFTQMSYAELVNYAEEQRQRIEYNANAIQHKEAKLRILTQNYNLRVKSQSEERMRVDQIRKEVERDAKELARLRKIQAELENQRTMNLGAKSELDSLHQMFSTKEKELRDAASKVTTLKTQLEQIQIRRQSAANAAIAVAKQAAREKRISDDRKLLAEKQRELSATDHRIQELMKQLKHQQQFQHQDPIQLLQQQQQQQNRPKAAIEPFHVTPPNSKDGSYITVNLKPPIQHNNNNNNGGGAENHRSQMAANNTNNNNNNNSNNTNIATNPSSYKGADFATAFSAVQNLPPPSSHHHHHHSNNHQVVNGYMTPPQNGSSPVRSTSNTAQVYANAAKSPQQNKITNSPQYASKSFIQNAYMGKGHRSPSQQQAQPPTLPNLSSPTSSTKDHSPPKQRSSVSSSDSASGTSSVSASSSEATQAPSLSSTVNFRRRPVLLNPAVLEPTPENHSSTVGGSKPSAAASTPSGPAAAIPDLIPANDKAKTADYSNRTASNSSGSSATSGSPGSSPESILPGMKNKYDQVETDIVHIRLNNIRAAKRRSWAQGATSSTNFGEDNNAANKSATQQNSSQPHHHGAERDHIQMMLKREQEKGRSNINLSWIFDKTASSKKMTPGQATTPERPTSLIPTASTASPPSSKTPSSSTTSPSPLQIKQLDSSPGGALNSKGKGSGDEENNNGRGKINNVAVQLEDGSVIRPPPPYSFHRIEEEEDSKKSFTSSEPSGTEESEISDNDNNRSLNNSSGSSNEKIVILPTPERGILKREPRKEKRNIEFDPLALLLDAALEGELELVKRSAQRMSNEVSECNDEGITALHNAICAGHYEIVRFLVEAGADVNAADSDGWTPLHCAASCNNLPMVKFLVERGSCVFATTVSDHETPADKCEEDEDGFLGCHQFLVGIQEKMGYMHETRVYCGYSYESVAEREDELSVHEGEPLVVIDRSDDSPEDQWWLCRRTLTTTCDENGDTDSANQRHPTNEQEGYIPRNYLSLYPRIKHQKYLPAGVNLNTSDQSDSTVTSSTNNSVNGLVSLQQDGIDTDGNVRLDKSLSMDEEIQSLCLDEDDPLPPGPTETVSSSTADYSEGIKKITVNSTLSSETPSGENVDSQP